MEVLNAIAYAFVALFILVTVHEFGHYWVARRCGVRVERFSIGFGKPFLRFKWDGTEFGMAPIPLGGYVKMYGETQDPDAEPIPQAEQSASFSHKSVYQRMAIVVAGPVANLILAVLFFWVVFLGGMTGYVPLIGSVQSDSPAQRAGLPVGELAEPLRIVSLDSKPVATWNEVFEAMIRRVGESGSINIGVQTDENSATRFFSLAIENWHSDTDSPQFLSSLGLIPYAPKMQAIFGEVLADSPAERAGLAAGDRVIEVDGSFVNDWEEWRNYVAARPGQTIEMIVDRGGRQVSLALVPEGIETENGLVGRVGVVAADTEWPEHLRSRITYSIPFAFVKGLQQTASTSSLILDSLKKLVTGQISTKSLGGPISIAKYAGASADAGWQSFFMFVAGLSVMLGIVNLLPIPVLDGGHLVFYVIEWAKGSPLNDVVQAVAVRMGMAVLLSVMILALYNDFGRL